MPAVFISAASVDLKHLRTVLHTAFSRAGFKVRTQDRSLGAAPRDVRKLLADTIQDCDCVIHLAGLGYGSEASEPFPENPGFKCSWTQFEYYFAHQQKKDVIAFVTASNLSHPGFEETGDQADRDRKRKLQQAHRERVASGEFDDTPLQGIVSRTSNETVEGADNLLEAVAAAIGTLKSTGPEWNKLRSDLQHQHKKTRNLRMLVVGLVALLTAAGVCYYPDFKAWRIESSIRNELNHRFDVGEHEEAFAYLDSQLSILVEIGDKRESSIHLIHEMALEALGIGAYRYAENCFEAILQSNIKVPEANLAYHQYLVFEKGEGLERRGDFDSARGVYELSKEIVPKVGLSGNDDIAISAWRARRISDERIADAYRATGANPDFLYENSFQDTQERARDDPTNIRHQLDLAIEFERRGDVELRDGRLNDSKNSYDRAFQIRNDPDIRNYSNTADLDLFVSLLKLGDVELERAKAAAAQSDPERARVYLATARTQYKKAENLTKPHTDDAWIENLAVCQEKQARIASDEGDHQASLTLWKAALKGLDSLDQPDFSTREKAVNILISLGRSAEFSGDLSTAAEWNSEALERAEELGGRPRGEQLRQIASNNLCWIRILEKRFAEALILAEDGSDLKIARLPGSPSLKLNLAHANLFNNKYEKAVVLYEEAFGENTLLRNTFLSDLNAFQQHMIEHPDLDRIRKHFGFRAEDP